LSKVILIPMSPVQGRRKLHREELHDLYSSPSIIRIIKLRRMKWAGHVARMGERRNAYRLLVAKPEEDQDVGGWKMLNICSVVHQCNTFTSYILLIVDMFRPHTAIFRC
jgi:hypothetical protein